MSTDKKSVFDKIANIYGLMYCKQKKKYSKILDGISDRFDFSNFQNIIDVGCGTGALCSVLYERGLKVTGIDSSYKMLKVGIDKNRHTDIDFRNISILNETPFNKKSFDISIACHVAHGLQPYDRHKMYDNMKSITKDYVIFYDYNDKKTFFSSLIEAAEGGDYFNFINVVMEELHNNFSSVQIIEISRTSNLYICSLDN